MDNLKELTACATGHRPNKLYGYDISDKRYIELKNFIKKVLVEFNIKKAISGMALGFDTVFALAVLELKDEGYDIKLTCAIPCKGHSSNWFNKNDIDRYNNILERADEVILVTPLPYAPYLMNVRNKYMVNESDIVISLWNGSSGGTKNCVEYAFDKGRDIYNINPNEFPFEMLKIESID